MEIAGENIAATSTVGSVATEPTMARPEDPHMDSPAGSPVMPLQPTTEDVHGFPLDVTATGPEPENTSGHGSNMLSPSDVSDSRAIGDFSSEAPPDSNWNPLTANGKQPKISGDLDAVSDKEPQDQNTFFDIEATAQLDDHTNSQPPSESDEVHASTASEGPGVEETNAPASIEEYIYEGLELDSDTRGTSNDGNVGTWSPTFPVIPASPSASPSEASALTRPEIKDETRGGGPSSDPETLQEGSEPDREGSPSPSQSTSLGRSSSPSSGILQPLQIDPDFEDDENHPSSRGDFRSPTHSEQATQNVENIKARESELGVSEQGPDVPHSAEEDLQLKTSEKTDITDTKLGEDAGGAKEKGTARRFQLEPSAAAAEWEQQKNEDPSIRNEAWAETIDQVMALVGLEHVKEQFLAIKAKIDTCREQEEHLNMDTESDERQQLVNIRTERFNVIFQGSPGTGTVLLVALQSLNLHDLTWPHTVQERPRLPVTSPSS